MNAVYLAQIQLKFTRICFYHLLSFIFIIFNNHQMECAYQLIITEKIHSKFIEKSLRNRLFLGFHRKKFSMNLTIVDVKYPLLFS